MPNRYIREGINSSRAVASLDPAAEVFYRRMLNVVDDFGRFEVDTMLIRSHAFPVHSNISESEISRWIAACEKAGLLVSYEAAGRTYLALTKTERPRARKSRYPDPSPHIAERFGLFTSVNICPHAKTFASNPNTNTDTNTNAGADTETPNPDCDEVVQQSPDREGGVTPPANACDFQSKSPANPTNHAQADHPQLSAHSALMGGQFPTEKSQAAFKNPLFYGGKSPGIFGKNELSFFHAQKTGFNTVFSPKIRTLQSPDREGGEIPSETEAVAQTAIAGIPPDFARFVYQDWSSRNGKDASGNLVGWLPYVTKRWVREQVEWKSGTHRGKKSGQAHSSKPPGAPTLAEVHAYAKEKWGTEPGCANWAASFYTHWNAPGRQWKRNNIPIDWKIELTQQVARWRK